MTARWRHLVDDDAQSSDATTFKEKLPSNGQLHTIMLKVKCTSGATENHGLSIRDVVDEIRVVHEGQEPLFVLSAVELEKRIQAYQGRACPEKRLEGAGVVAEMTFPIMFGKDVYDPNYFLPLDRFKTVKLEVDYSPTISATAGWATGTTVFDVLALITPHNEPLSYLGTFKTRRIHDHTTLISGIEPFDLPSGRVFRDIGIYCYEAGIADNVDVTYVTLEDQDDGVKLYESGWDDLITLTQQIKGARIRAEVMAFIQDNDSLNMFIDPILSYGVEVEKTLDFSGDIAYLAQVDAIAGDELTLCVGTATIVAASEVLATYATDSKIFVWAEGKAPSYFGLISYAHYDESGRWLDSKEVGDLRLKLTQAAAGGQVYISVQEVAVF